MMMSNHDDNNNNNNNNISSNSSSSRSSKKTNNNKKKNYSDDDEQVTTSVIFVLKKDAKTIKTILEKRGWINKDYRMSSAQKEAFIPTTTTTDVVVDDDISFKECLAIPVLPSFLHNNNNNNNNILQMEVVADDDCSNSSVTRKIIGYGKQSCPFSSSVLGDHKKRHHLLNQQQQQQESSNNKQHQHQHQQLQQEDGCCWSPLKQALLLSIRSVFFNNNINNKNDHEEESAVPIMAMSEAEEVWRKEIEQMDSTICPTKVEYLGDDHNIVLSPLALRMEDMKNLLIKKVLGVVGNQQNNNSNNNNNNNNNNTDDDATIEHLFMEELWNQVAKIYQCPRILRKGGVDPNSRIRQTGYQLLWSSFSSSDAATATTATTSNESTSSSSQSNNNQNWITVTEQGIHQSFDVTKVMFSRGNISEKIRFGTKLVQRDDVVLDLYAGIGYYTLPALILGNAAYVYACEWNPHAVTALQRNLRDNNILDEESKVTIIQGDCRNLILPAPLPNLSSNRHHHHHEPDDVVVGPINRVSLGLLPSSEGGWKIAIQALIGTLPRELSSNKTTTEQQQEQEGETDAPPPPPRRSASAEIATKGGGGWLHVHGNVPVKERDVWAKWLVCKLYDLILKELSTTRSCVHNHNNNDDNDNDNNGDWIVICHHVEKVKSFAPTVNHYVADVFVSPKPTTTTTTTTEKLPIHPMHSQEQEQEQQIETVEEVLARDDTVKCLVYNSNTKRFETCCLETTLSTPPSCALSTDGVLNQDWMMAK